MGIIGTVVSAIAGWVFIGIALGPVFGLLLCAVVLPYRWFRKKYWPKPELIPFYERGVAHKNPENTGTYCLLESNFGTVRQLSPKKCVCRNDKR
ncbi:hypothetical protein GCM10015535_36130 [Streptomyces gelaticus]|uniref:Uncharacterized protein n=1 Tax=Streptomyces gelaticus TaxID=285446 RepID=A0ABQ2W3A1_9ACTN|nr:hypothetical protein GCM10015535_36130 [Streptomyces gelaticus]